MAVTEYLENVVLLHNIQNIEMKVTNSKIRGFIKL
jgi:hypothetical protein